ncbi:alpha-aspartyl dipeptidase-like isoform X2 [Amphibalanus amphitrite]|uniref:alpha-aspartyl dipeptidase-like isoform X2 n=2 Tax=Amphibalanus amphitrite TaxID=1232801 RepID=UPI001C90AA7B|nr:alpha-aspartyl dipeptidase-like isoform X2 [Amphibalanus amphitrite]
MHHLDLHGPLITDFFWSFLSLVAMRKLLLLSSSSYHGAEGFLGWCGDLLTEFLGKEVSRVLFVPYALFDYNEYTTTVRDRLKQLGYEVDGIHELENPLQAVEQAQAIFVGGGNSFRLLKTMYDHRLVDAVRKRVLQDGMPYIGSSAGTNLSTVSICTTNDMPIVHPPTFEALALVPFNINPHYIDPDPSSTHMGETREKRIREYHMYADRPPVLGLREGSALLVLGDKAVLKGPTGAKLFKPKEEAEVFESGSDVSFLLK